MNIDELKKERMCGCIIKHFIAVPPPDRVSSNGNVIHPAYVANVSSSYS